jgi:hypothetical protein
LAGVGNENATIVPKIGEAVFIQGNSIEAPRVPDRPKNVVLAYKGTNEYRHLIEKYDWNINTMLFILECESSGNPLAVGDRNTPHHSYGLLQIRNLPERNLNIEDLFDPEYNVNYAYQLWQKQGYRAWYNCYMRYLSSI